MQIWDNIELCLADLKAKGVEYVFPLTTKGSATPHTVDLNRPVALLMYQKHEACLNMFV